MQEITLMRLSGAIVIIGMLLLALTYEPEFQNTTLTELLRSTKDTPKGIISARIEYVIKNYPVTQLVVTDGMSAVLYYPRQTELAKNDFITAYVEREDNNTHSFYAYKVVRND